MLMIVNEVCLVQSADFFHIDIFFVEENGGISVKLTNEA
jgi:hypothetical protein